MVARVAPVVLFLTTFGVAQDEARPTSNLDIVRGVLDGGRFEESKWRRGADGALEVHSFADLGLEIEGERFRPMLGEDAVLGLRNAGPVGLFAMACHGPADLLAMTPHLYRARAEGRARAAALRALTVGVDVRLTRLVRERAAD